MGSREAAERESVPVAEYIRGDFIPLSRLPHDWGMHAALALTPAEERTMVREPARAVPAAIAQRLPKLRVLLVPFLACTESGDLVCFSKPQAETHTSVWEESEEHIDLLLSCRELNAHDTGFELLASVAELLRTRLTHDELARYTQLLEEELRMGVTGEIDEETLAAKRPLLSLRARRARSRAAFETYRDVSFVSTMAEYMHGLWHDVEIRTGADDLPLPQLRRRITLLAEMFPPNPGYSLFAKELEGQEQVEGNS